MRAPLVAIGLAAVALGCEARPARDASYGSTTTTAAASEHHGRPASASVFSSKLDSAPRRESRRTAEETSGARGIEQQGSDGSTPTWGRGGNTSAGTLADPNAKQGTGRGEAINGDSKKNDDQDRPGGKLGAVDQGNSSSETKITADIRKQLVVSSTLSFSAKNVKVITTGSKVTLRGTVKSEQEKAEIDGIARGTNGVSEVDDQLEVKK